VGRKSCVNGWSIYRKEKEKDFENQRWNTVHI
jgi:hypothetical protein